MSKNYKDDKAVMYGEGHIFAEVRKARSKITPDLEDLEYEIKDMEKRLKQLKANRASLNKRIRAIPAEFKELQKAVDILKKPREAHKKLTDAQVAELNYQQRLKISEYTGTTTFL